MNATTNAPRTWDETDIPSVADADLNSALSLWLARERAGLVLVADEPIQTPRSLEAAVLDLFDDPVRGYSVLLRLRCLTAALSTGRFRHLVRPAMAGELASLVTVVARLRLNPSWGMSPVRIAWSMAATEAMVATRKAA